MISLDGRECGGAMARSCAATSTIGSPAAIGADAMDDEQVHQHRAFGRSLSPGG